MCGSSSSSSGLLVVVVVVLLLVFTAEPSYEIIGVDTSVSK